jgi:hypothetical protein
MSNDLTDSAKITLLRRILRLRVPPDILLILLVTVIEPVAARLLMVRCRWW